MPLTEKAQEVFSADRFACGIGCRIESCREGEAVVSLRIDPQHMNAAGRVQGGVIFTLADYAFGIASNIEGRLTFSTFNAISYFRGVTSGVLTARAVRLSSTGRTCCYDISVIDETGRQVAHMLGNGIMPDQGIK